MAVVPAVTVTVAVTCFPMLKVNDDKTIVNEGEVVTAVPLVAVQVPD
jgi:hypothetical protein